MRSSTTADDTLPRPGLARLPTVAAIAAGAFVGAIVGIIALTLSAFPARPSLQTGMTFASSAWIALLGPFLLRAFFTVLVQGWLERYGRVVAALVTAALEAWLSVRLASIVFSIDTSEAFPRPAAAVVVRHQIAAAIGPFVYATLRAFGASYALTVATNIAALTIEML